MTRRFIVDLIDSDETDRFVGKYGADEITNMTNGDVMKAMFPDIEFTEDVHYDLENGRWVEITDDKYNMTFDETWWNAPYKTPISDNGLERVYRGYKELQHKRGDE